MKVNLLINFFKSENPERQAELESVLRNNLLNQALDRVINLPSRPTYEDFFYEGFSYPNEVNIIANSDIYSDESSIGIIKRFYENTDNVNTVLALSRWDVDSNGKAKHHNDRGSQDVWVFFGNILPLIKESVKFQLGKPGCDNRIAHILAASNFPVINPSLDIRFYHLHNSGVRNYNLEDTILGNHLLISPTGIIDIHATEYWERTEEQVKADVQEKIKNPEQKIITTVQEDNLPRPLRPKQLEENTPEEKPVEIPKPKVAIPTIAVQAPVIKNSEKVTNKGIKILHLAVMAGENGFTNPFKQLGEYHEINFPHIKSQNGYNYLQTHVLNTALAIRPDLIFCQLQEEGFISGETFTAIKKQSPNTTIVIWSGDIRHETPRFIKEMLFSKAVDVASYSNMRDVNELRRFGNSEFLNIGFDPNIYRSGIPKLEGGLQRVCFMGANYGSDHFPLSQERIDLVESMFNEFRGEFGLYGNGWTNFAQVGFLDQATEAAMYNTCKIAISFSHFNEERYFSDRLLRAMGSGIMVLSHNYKGIEKDFEIGKHLDIFNNLSELKAKVHHYLNNPAEASKIAEAGRQLVSEKNTFSDMVNNIYSIYEKYKNK